MVSWSLLVLLTASLALVLALPRIRAWRDARRAALVASYQRTYVGLQGWVPLQGGQPKPAVTDDDQNVAVNEVKQQAPVMRTAEQEQVLRDAKLVFMRLIAAWDTANASELKQVLTPDAYGRMVDEATLAPRPGAPTDILTLSAESVTPPTASETAHVRFTGMYRTALSSSARRFDAVWSLRRESDAWRVSEIQSV